VSHVSLANMFHSLPTIVIYRDEDGYPVKNGFDFGSSEMIGQSRRLEWQKDFTTSWMIPMNILEDHPKYSVGLSGIFKHHFVIRGSDVPDHLFYFECFGSSFFFGLFAINCISLMIRDFKSY
jgi:hypothetical protein